MLRVVLAALFVLGMGVQLSGCSPQPPALPTATRGPAVSRIEVTASRALRPAAEATVSPTLAPVRVSPTPLSPVQALVAIAPTPRPPLPTAHPPATTAAMAVPSDPYANLLRPLGVTDFEALHAPLQGDANLHLIFGNLKAAQPAAGLAPDLAAFLGRWEGYDYSPFALKDLKMVLFVEEITDQGGKAHLWSGTTLQFPLYVGQVAFRVVPGASPSIEWEMDAYRDVYAPEDGTARVTMSLSYVAATHTLHGGARPAGAVLAGTALELGRGQAFDVYRDYGKYFADHRVYAKAYQNPALLSVGSGYMVYLPEGYEADASTNWPLIFFLIGSGERGSNPYLLARHGPLKVVLEQQPLPFIVVAPTLNATTSFRSYPEAYLDGALNEVLDTYRVDRRRIYLTGISMGGEAAYRFALFRPQAFAALVPMAGFNAQYNTRLLSEGFLPFPSAMGPIKDIPTWVVHGAADPIVPLSVAQRTVDDLERAGANVKFTVLANHGHDVWTDTYGDPAFYSWLLQHQRP